VELGGRVGPARDALLGEPLDVVALVLHALVVADDLHLAACLPSGVDGVRKLVRSQVEHANLEGLLGFADVGDQLVNVLGVGEEEGVDVSRLGLEELLVGLGQVDLEAFEDLLVGIILHLGGGDLEQRVNYISDVGSIALARELCNELLVVIDINLLGFKVRTSAEEDSDLLERSFEGSVFGGLHSPTNFATLVCRVALQGHVLLATYVAHCNNSNILF